MEMQIVRTIRFVPDETVCPRRIEIEVTEDGKVFGIELDGGCHGCQTLLMALLKGKRCEGRCSWVGEWYAVSERHRVRIR